MELHYENLKAVFKPYAKDALKRARIALKVKGYSGKKTATNNTGNLSDGLGFDIVEDKSTNNLTLEFTSKEIYGAFTERGVNGTEVKQGSPYSFKGKNVNQKAIIKWLKSPKIKLRDMTKGPTEGRFIEKSDSNIKAAAYMIGRSMALKGIKGIGFMGKSQAYAFEDHKDAIAVAFTNDVADAMQKEILDNLPKGLNTTVKKS